MLFADLHPFAAEYLTNPDQQTLRELTPESTPAVLETPANAPLLEKVPVQILSPRAHFEATGRLDAYNAWVPDMKQGRRAYLEGYDVSEDIIRATNNE